jgi:hypothetical protein
LAVLVRTTNQQGQGKGGNPGTHGNSEGATPWMLPVSGFFVPRVVEDKSLRH